MARPSPTRVLRQRTDAPDHGLLRRLRAVLTGPRRMTVIGLMLLAAGVVVAGLALLQAAPHTSVAAPATTSVITPARGLSSTPVPATPSSTPAPSSSSTPPGASADPVVATPVAALPDTDTTVVGVQAGDTLWALARHYATTVAALQALNGLGSSTRIDAGQLLRVPAGRDPLPAPVTAIAAASAPATATPAPVVPAAAPGTAAAAPAPATVAAVSPQPVHHPQRHQRPERHHTTPRTSSTGSIHCHQPSPQGGPTAMTHHGHTHARHTRPSSHGKGHR